MQAGILDEKAQGQTDLATAISDEKTLTDTQKRALLQILRSFQAENRSTAADSADNADTVSAASAASAEADVT